MTPLSPLVGAFVGHFGEMGSRWGINRTVGQIYALIFVAPEPLHADDIAEKLAFSRSNVSMGLKELQAWRPRRRVGDSLNEDWQPDAQTLQRFGIDPSWLQRFPHELSGGELQRLNIVRALVPGLRVLIADEMTAMHDTITQAALWRALRESLAGREVAVMVVSHDAALLDALGARRLPLAFHGAT